MLSGQCDHRDVFIMSSGYCLDDIGRIAAAGVDHQNIAALSQGSDLLGENVIKMIVVGYRGDCCGIGGEGDRRQCRSFTFKAVKHRSRKLLGIGGGTAVAAGQHLVVVQQGGDQSLRSEFNQFTELAQGFLLVLDALAEMESDAVLQAHGLSLKRVFDPLDGGGVTGQRNDIEADRTRQFML